MSEEKKKRHVPKQEIVALDPVAFKELRKEEARRAESNLKEEDAPHQPSILEEIVKSIKAQNAMQAAQLERMSFQVDPHANYSGSLGFYKLKQNLTPDHIIKRVIGPGGDELVNEILQARSNHISSFGRPRTDRFSVGYEFQDMDKNAQRTEEEQKKIQDRIDRAKRLMWQCGRGTLEGELDQVNLSQFLKLVTRDGLGFGRLACERIWWTNPETGNKELYAWRASDAGTMYKILPQKEHDQQLRQEAIRQLQQIKNKKIDVEKYLKDQYRYVQVIEGRPTQAFTEEEMVIYNLYPTTGIEYNGYPLTPIDQALNAITTHINITVHNKLYFQHGRAAKGMLVFQSAAMDEAAVQKIRLQFHQSINSVQNSWRMPVFQIDAEDKLTWQPIDGGSGRDAEFQYLMDNNARVILSAFQVSPEELPGYAHLARGTNTQALAESSNEWKLTAARDVGLRPLLADIQDFLNTHILPFVDQELAKTHQIVLTGLDKDDPEKESTRLQQDMNVHMNYNEVMDKVEKNPVPVELGGDFPLNPQFQAVLDKYLTVGVILENFFKIKGASSDPRYQYIRDPFYFNNQQLVLQKAQIAMQQSMQAQQMMQQQAMAEQGIQTDENGSPASEDEGDGQDDSNAGPSQTSKAEKGLDAVREISEKNAAWAANNYVLLEKAAKNNHDKISRQLLKRHKELVSSQMEQWKKQSKKALNDMAKVLKQDEKG